MTTSDTICLSPVAQVCPPQTDPLQFFALLVSLDGRPLLSVMEPYRQQIHSKFLYAFRPDGSPRYKRGLKGRAKKTSKTTDEILEALYKLLGWQSAGGKGNQCYHVVSDLGQVDDGLDLGKKLEKAKISMGFISRRFPRFFFANKDLR